MTDYYDILGVSRSASQDEIKRAYRRLAKKYHPDSKAGSRDEELFKKINEAYQVLSDPKKKQAYDQFGEAAFSETSGFGQGFGPFGFDFGGKGFTKTGRYGPFTYTYTTYGEPEGFEFGDLFSDAFSTFFEKTPFGFPFGRRVRGRDLHLEVTVDFATAVRGAERRINLNGRTIKIRIPKGVRNGLELRFRGEGEKGPESRGGVFSRGDLFVRVNVLTPAGITLSGSDIYAEKEISVYDALLGGEVLVPVVDPRSSSGLGEEKLKIPAGTQPGTTFRLKGKGMPRLYGRGQGDAYIKVRVKIPEKLSREEREVLEGLRATG